MSKTTVRIPPVEFALAADPPEPVGGMVRRKGVIFRAGDYSQSHEFTMTPDELREVARTFTPIKIDHGHPTVDGPMDFGTLDKVEVSPDGTTLYGYTSTHPWVTEAMRKAKKWLVSASFDRPTKALRRLSLVTRPKITDAELQAAFACACGHDTKEKEETMEAWEEEALKKLRAMDEGSRVAIIDALDADPPPGDDEDDEEDDMEEDEDAVSEVPYVGDATAAEFAAREAAREARIAELEEKDRRREAEVFVESAAKDRYILPWEKPGLIAEHIQAAVDDLGSQAQFSDGKRSSRVQRFRDRILSRKPHHHADEANFGGGGSRTLENGSKAPETDREYAARVVAKYNGRNRIKNGSA